MKATCTWTNGVASIVTNHRGHEIVLDLPPAKGGDDSGATAFEVCLMSYAGCVNTIFQLLAVKMRIDFKSLEVEARGAMNGGAATLTDVEIDLRIATDASETKIAKCLEQTLKTCPVGILFDQAGINKKYNIIKM